MAKVVKNKKRRFKKKKPKLRIPTAKGTLVHKVDKKYDRKRKKKDIAQEASDE